LQLQTKPLLTLLYYNIPRTVRELQPNKSMNNLFKNYSETYSIPIEYRETLLSRCLRICTSTGSGPSIRNPQVKWQHQAKKVGLMSTSASTRYQPSCSGCRGTTGPKASVTASIHSG